MIQEKDFLYRVPVKNAFVTTPGKQVRNPEILVDLEGGEFMNGNILDANSTNKLIDQSVKDAIDNSIENGNYVTKDLLEAETSARTKSDEDLNAKIKAEQTRAEGKEKQISEAIEGKQDEGNYVTYSSEDSDNYYFHKGFTSSVPFAVDDSDGNEVEYGINGITSSNHSNCLATSDGTFKPISDFASEGDVSSLRVGLLKKQDKITVNSVDVTDIETADITKLRTIVIELIDALTTSGLIRQNSNLE